jgi:hypothetical protein
MVFLFGFFKRCGSFVPVVDKKPMQLNICHSAHHFAAVP